MDTIDLFTVVINGDSFTGTQAQVIDTVAKARGNGLIGLEGLPLWDANLEPVYTWFRNETVRQYI